MSGAIYMVKNVIFSILLFIILTPRGIVYAVNSVPFIPADHFVAQPQWNNPVRGIGLPDARVATISAIGYPGYFGTMEEFPISEFATMSAVKFDIIAKNVDNIWISPTQDGSPLACSKAVSAGTELGHNYLTFTAGECSGMTIQHWNDHLFGYKLTYYYGANPVVATIDSIMAIPIFTDGNYDTTVKNNVTIYTSPTLPFIENARANEITLLMQSKVPWNYIYALSTLNMGASASTSAIPDVSFHYQSKYKGDTVFDYDFLVSGTDLPDLENIRTTLKTVISVVLWIGVIWYFSKHWRVIFQ